MDYAIIKTGGLQFRVSEGDQIRVPRLASEPGDSIELEDVLALNRGGELQVGTPVVEGAKVAAEVVDHGRAKKLLIYKKKRRKFYQRKAGHRQGYTTIKITKI